MYVTQNVFGVEVQLHEFLKHDIWRSWMLSFTARKLYPGEEPGSHFRRRWIGPKLRRDATEKNLPDIWSLFCEYPSHYSDWATEIQPLQLKCMQQTCWQGSDKVHAHF